MKKFIYIFAAALMIAGSSAANAQGRHPMPHYHHFERAAEGLGLHFGFAHSFNRDIDRYDDDKVRNKDGMNGFHVGLTKDFTLIPYSLYINSGLDYVYQSDKPDVPALSKAIVKRQDHRMNIPIMLKYEYPVTPGISAFAQVGPTLSFGLSSNLSYRMRMDDGASAGVRYNYFSGKYKLTGEAESLKTIMMAQAPDAKYRRFDTYLGGAVGAKLYDILEVSFGYDWGIVNQYRGAVAKDYKMRRQQYYVTVGVRF